MNRLPRTTYRIGAIGGIIIGTLHTVTHFVELAGGDLRSRFDEMGTIDVSGQTVSSWDLFQGMSILMGAFCIAAGLINLTVLRAVGPDGRPPAAACLANIAVLATVIAVGVAYLGPMQVYGGMFGIAMFAVPLLPPRDPANVDADTDLVRELAGASA